MIGNIGPCASCCEHTLNTLRYADRVKELKNENREANSMMLPRGGGSSTIEFVKRKEEDNLADLDFIKKKSQGALAGMFKQKIGQPAAAQRPLSPKQEPVKSYAPKPGPSRLMPAQIRRTAAPQYEDPSLDY